MKTGLFSKICYQAYYFVYDLQYFDLSIDPDDCTNSEIETNFTVVCPINIATGIQRVYNSPWDTQVLIN
jgi:hypothetical protein